MKNLRIVNVDNFTIINYYHIPNGFDDLLIKLLNEKGIDTVYNGDVLSVVSPLTLLQEVKMRNILPEYYHGIGMRSTVPEGDPLLPWDIEKIKSIVDDIF